MMKRVISLELNELNFHFVKEFISQGELPNFAKLLETRQLVETHSEKSYPYLEPWIQWPTVYTGKTYDEHKIFRLGDAVNTDHVQIWDYLESRGLTVGALSPMNAKNRCENPAFFLPDPWTETTIVAEPRVAQLFELVRQVVNNNASEDPSFIQVGRQLLPLALPYVSADSVVQYLRILGMAIRYKWAKAVFLDQLLADLFLALVRKHRPHYASLFLNAGAHIQHHHIFDSNVYSGAKRNPAWYSKAAEHSVDPLLFIYKTYDSIVAKLLAMKDVHLFITTGLSQIPNERDHYQYRLRDFDSFLTQLDVEGATVLPRMSRDFLLEFENEAAAAAGVEKLNRATCQGTPLFSVENRGETLFCQVAYYGMPAGLKAIEIGDVPGDYSDNFVLVSIENGIHQTIGYHIDCDRPKADDQPVPLPLTEVFDRLCVAALEEHKAEVKLAS